MTLIPFFSGLGPNERAALSAASSVRSYQRGEPVFRDDDDASTFCFVVRGRVKLVKTAPDGAAVILSTPGRGRLICAIATNEQAYCCSCVAMEDDTEVLSVARQALLTLVGDPGRALLREVCTCSAAACQRIEVLASKTIERRLAMLLLKLAEHSGLALPDGATRVPVVLTRQELASLCGTSLETAIRVMSALKRAGVVRTVARGFVIDDMPALRSRAVP